MRHFTLNEETLSRILHEARYSLMVSDEAANYEIPLDAIQYKSARHFVARRIPTAERVVLKYSSIRSVKVDYIKILECA